VSRGLSPGVALAAAAAAADDDDDAGAAGCENKTDKKTCNTRFSCPATGLITEPRSR